MNQATNHRAEVDSILGTRLNPSKAVIAADSYYNRFRIRAHEGSSAYLFPPSATPDVWTMSYRRKTIAQGPLEDMLPHFDELGWLLSSEPPAPSVLQLTLPDVLRGWELAVPHYIGTAIADLLRSAKLPAAEQTAALQDAARNIELAITELSR